MDSEVLHENEVFIFDLDGTVYIGDEPTAEVADVIRTIRDRGKAVFFLSNNSSQWKDDYISRLDAMGIPATEEEIVLSTDSVIAYLTTKGFTDVYVVGTEAMRAALAREGITPDATHPTHVVVGFDTTLTYAKIRQASLLLQNGAGFVAAHPDRVCPTPEGGIPDCGAITAMLETATGRVPDRVLGKPDPMMIEPIVERTTCSKDEMVIVGDRLSTDIQLAKNEGICSVCVLSGDSTATEVSASPLEPDIVLQRASGLLGDPADTGS